ncbi:Benzoate--CoA ligase [Listeria fleischmannii subsp. fleischmannii]|uniref:Benzoate--CoA ligase n=1 Tax=Listeria fleischmannii subsp. fleischmannii TaxID=1671902 RepID=A0A2X3GKM3_9LIST|nr:Benzoate--CoA ligase [Listeria fleischmannii subsp. fleischmannii]
MDSNYLIAPAKYNITDEITKFDSDKIALIWKDNHNERTWTYHELLVNARKFANVLTKQGIQKGDHVIVMTPRLLETYAIYMGLWMVGAVIIPASELLKAHDLAYRIDHAGVKGIITYKGMTEEFEKIEHTPSVKTRILIEEEKVGWLDYSRLMSLAPNDFTPIETSRDDACLLAFTSGTTGNPKGVVHVHGWGYAHIRIAADHWLDIRETDTVWATAGPGWQKWVWSPFLSILGKGATGFIYGARFNPEHQLRLLDSEKIDVLCCTPTEYRLMAKVPGLDKYQLTHLRSAVSAGNRLIAKSLVSSKINLA